MKYPNLSTPHLKLSLAKHNTFYCPGHNMSFKKYIKDERGASKGYLSERESLVVYKKEKEVLGGGG